MIKKVRKLGIDTIASFTSKKLKIMTVKIKYCGPGVATRPIRKK